MSIIVDEASTHSKINSGSVMNFAYIGGVFYIEPWAHVVALGLYRATCSMLSL